MLDAIRLLGRLGIVPTIHRAHQIARYAADAVERNGLEPVGDTHVLAVDVQLEGLQHLAGVLGVRTVEVRLDLALRDRLVVLVGVGDCLLYTSRCV